MVFQKKVLDIRLKLRYSYRCRKRYSVRPRGHVSVCAGFRLERVPAGPVPFGREISDIAADGGRPECHPGTAVVVHVRPDPAHDRPRHRHGHCSGALHRARVVGGGHQGLTLRFNISLPRT